MQKLSRHQQRHEWPTTDEALLGEAVRQTRHYKHMEAVDTTIALAQWQQFERNLQSRAGYNAAEILVLAWVADFKLQELEYFEHLEKEFANDRQEA